MRGGRPPVAWPAAGPRAPRPRVCARREPDRKGAARQGAISVRRGLLPAIRARLCAPSDRRWSNSPAPRRSRPETCARQVQKAPSRAIFPAPRDRSRPRPAGARRPGCSRARRRMPARRSGNPCAAGRASSRWRSPPIARPCPCGNRCRRSARPSARFRRAAERGSCDHAGRRPPCRCAPAYGSSRRSRALAPPRADGARRRRIFRPHGIAGRRRRPDSGSWRCADRGNRCTSRPRRTCGFA